MSFHKGRVNLQRDWTQLYQERRSGVLLGILLSLIIGPPILVGFGRQLRDSYHFGLWRCDPRFSHGSNVRMDRSRLRTVLSGCDCGGARQHAGGESQAVSKSQKLRF